VLPMELQITSSVLGILSAMAGLATLLFLPLIRKRVEHRRALDRFLRDWVGEDAVPGRDRVPGVMERLNRLDGELKRNGGSTMKDAVHRIEEAVIKVAKNQEEQGAALADWGATVSDIDARLRKTERKLQEHDDHLSAHDARTTHIRKAAQ